MTHKQSLLAATAVAVAAAGAAASSNITEAYSFSFLGNANLTTPFTGPISTDTALLNGDRLDAPGPGIDSIIPDLFPAFCVELGFQIQNPGAHKVFPLLGSVTDPTGGPGPAVLFDPLRTSRAQRLWGAFFGAVVDSNTAAAFQLALWEITYDTDMTLVGPGPHFVDGPQFQLGITDTAEAWLAIVNSAAIIPEPTLYLLTAPGNQDIISVPTPGVGAIFGLGVVAALRRRR